MKLSNWKLKLLSGMLCFCLVFQNLTISAFAEEGTSDAQITEIQEVTDEAPVLEDLEAEESLDAVETFIANEEPETPETSETIEEPETSETPETTEEPVASEESTVPDELVEYKEYEEVLLAEKTTYGAFSNLTMVNKGFGVQITGGTYAYDLTGQTSSHYLYLACYDANDNRQSLQSLRSMSGGSASSFNVNGSYAVHADTAYVRLELGTNKDNILEVYESFEVDGHPDITMSVSKVNPETGSVAITAAYTGDMENIIGTTTYGENITIELNYGTSEDESNWSKISTNVSFMGTSGNEQTAVFSGLESNTTYYGKVRFMARLYDQATYTYITVWEQTTDIESFTTKESGTYNLKEAFSDATFRAGVLSQLKNYDKELTEDSNVTSVLLEKITYLSLNRSNASTAAIKDITGVELLTGLTSLYLNNHEISSIDQIDWSKLSRLTSLYLEGNDIAKLPDLSTHPSLNYLSFDYNMLPQEELDKAAEMMPAGMTLYSNLFVTQRTNGFELLYDEDNYIYGTAVPLTVHAQGFKKGLNYSIKTYIDGVETPMTLQTNYTPNRLSIANTGLAEGSHTIKAQLYSGETLVEETEEYTFNIVDEPIFLLNDSIYVVGDTDVYSVYAEVYYSYSPLVSKMSIVNDAGVVYAESSGVNVNYSSTDPRYKEVTSESYRTLYRVYANMNTRYNTIPVGSYDLLIANSDGTETRLEDVIKVLDGSDAVITGCSMGYNYDSTGDYFYLNLSGTNIDSSQLSYSLVQFGKIYPVQYVTYKEVYNGVIVKLKKDGWSKLSANAAVKVTIAPKSGYEIVNGDSAFDAYINTSVFYCDYNPVTKKLEAAFTDDLGANNKTVSVKVREGSNQNTYPVVASATAVVSNGLAYFDLKSEDGTAFAPKIQSYYMFFEVNGKVYQVADYININNSGSSSGSYNYWSVSPVIKGTELTYAYFYSDIPYDADMDLSQFTVSVIGENVSSDSIVDNIWTYESNGCAVIGVKCAASSLAIGDYQIVLYRGGDLLPQTPGTLTVLGDEHFILNSISAAWKNESEMYVYVYTPFVRESDEYEVILTDYSGNEVEGLSAAVEQRYINSVWLSVSGLDYANAQRNYYIKVQHKTLGEPVTLSGSPFYSDSRGVYSQVYYSRGAYSSMENNRVVGINANSARLPLTVKVYRPYDADIVNELILESDDLQDSVYYFTKTFYESLPSTDSMYDLVMIDSEGYCSIYEGAVLGYYGMFDSEKKWSYTVDKTVLYANKDGEQTATIKVVDNTETPTYKSSNTNVVTVTQSETDAALATIEAIGAGEAVITITVDGTSKTFTVTVKKVVEKIELNAKSIALVAGNYVELKATILPVEVQEEGQHVTFSSSDESIIMIEKEYDDNMVLLRAMETGTATITAVLDGTEISAACEVNVWDYTVDGVSGIAEVSLCVNKKDEKTATIQVIDSKTKPVFESSDPEVATVAAVAGNNRQAVVTAVGVGKAGITIKIGDDSVSFTVIVKQVVEKIKLNETSISLATGDTAELTAQILPAETQEDGQHITFISSDESVVAVSEEEGHVAKLDALKPGTATITAVLDGTEISATCEVNVLWDYTVDVALVDGSVPLYVNREAEKTATIQVIGSKTAKPTFKSSNTGVVTVVAVSGNATQAVLTAVGVGTAEISITADGVTKKISVVVDRKFVVESLELNLDSITMTENAEKVLTVNVLPAEAWNDEFVIDVESTDSEIALADTDIDNNIVVTALKKGTTTVTVSLKVGEEIFTATCEVTVLGVFDEDVQEQKAAAEQQYVLLNAYAKNTATLKDVTLSEGWTWEDDSVKLIADNAAPVQYYGAVYEEDGYEPFRALIPVAVSKLTGIAAEGSNTLLAETTGTYDISYKYTGYQPVAADAHGFDSHYSVVWTASGKTPFVEIAENDATTAVRLTAADVTANKTQTVKVVLTVDSDAKKTFSASLKLTVLAKPYVDEITISEADQTDTKVAYTYDTANQIFNIDLKDISTVKDAVTNTISLSAVAKALGIESAAKMKWTSSDTSVATVKYTNNGKDAVVTVKKAGTSVIKVVAQDGGKFEEEILIVVKDYKPILESKSVTVNLYSTEGTAFVIKEQNGNAISSVELLENDVTSTRVNITKSEDSYIVKIAENSGITKKTTVKPILRIVTEDGSVYNENISVVVNATKPTASVSVKTKANLFYTDAEAVYKINSKYAIASVEDVTVTDGYRFRLAEYASEEGTLTFDTEEEWSPDILSANENRASKPVTKVVLKVAFKGYTDAAAQTITVNVATTTTKPSLKLNDMIFVPGVTEGVTQVYDTKAKEVYILSEAESIEVISDNSKTNDVTSEKTADGIKVVYDGSKNVTYKAALTSSKWTQALTLNGKITVAKQQNLVLDTTKVTLNTATSVQKNGTTAIGVSVNNHDAKVESITYETDKNSAKLINNGYLYFEFDEGTQQIRVGLNQGKQGDIKNGTYKFTINGNIEVAGQSVSLKKTTLSIVLTNKAPTVTLSAKGSIDLIQRANTSILYTSKLANVTAEVVDVRLAGGYAEYFEAEMSDGKVKISAADSPMSTKITYPVDVILTLDNGMEVSKTVKIKPVSKTPKVTAELTKGTLYKTGDTAFTFGLTSSVATAEIEKVYQVTDKNSQYFNLAYDEENEKVTISLSEEAVKLKPGKYTVSYQVYFEGAAYNAKPVTVKFTATVK